MDVSLNFDFGDVFPSLKSTLASLLKDGEDELMDEISLEFNRAAVFIKLKRPHPKQEELRRFWKPNMGIRRLQQPQELFKNDLYVFPEVMTAMQTAVGACDQLVSGRLLLTETPTVATLKDFEELTKVQFDSLRKFLPSWRDNLVNQLFGTLNPIGTGWYDLQITDWTTYGFSKIRVFLDYVNQRIVQSLRVSVKQSATDFVQWMAKACRETLKVPDDFIWEGSLLEKPFQVSPPSFFIELKINQLDVVLEAEPGSFKFVAQDYLDKAVLVSHSVSIIDPDIMRGLVFAPNLHYSSVGLLDPDLESLRALLEEIFHKTLVVLRAYCRRFEEHVEFYLSDVDETIAPFTDPDVTVLAIRDAVLFHMKMRDYVLETFPDDNVIGPFFVQSQPLKQFLVEKRSLVVSKLLESLRQCVRNRVFAIVADYRGIFERLTEPPKNIVILSETQQWMETIPVLVKANEEAMKLVAYDLEVLDSFLCNLPSPDFALQWEAHQWPARIFRQVSFTHENQVVDLERFKKNQTGDVAIFDTTIEGLNVEITNFRFLHDPTEAPKLAKKCAEVVQQIQEAVETAELLNTNQALLDLPELDFGSVSLMMGSFGPFAELWSLAVDLEASIKNFHTKPLRIFTPQDVKATFGGLEEKFSGLLEKFSDLPKIQETIEHYLGLITGLAPEIKLFEHLKHPCWTRTCYERFEERTGIEIPHVSKALSLDECLQMTAHMGELEEILGQAVKEEAEREEAERKAMELRRIEEEILEKRRLRRIARKDI